MRVLLPALMLVAAPASAASPHRILSLNLCADQYLIALADRDQIGGLTRLAHNPRLSAAAAQAAGLPTSGASAEEVLAHAPDLILAGWPGQADPARRQGARAPVVVVPPANSYADIKTQVRLVAAAVGHPRRGAALIAAMDRALAAVPRNGQGRIAAEYQRRGYMSGGGTLVDELVERVGLVNLATRIGRPALSRLSLEEMVAARPDFLIVEMDRSPRARGSEMLVHPALAGIGRLRLPEALTVCGGPAFPDAARMLAWQLMRHDRLNARPATHHAKRPPAHR